jgi:hypothetical protein
MAGLGKENKALEKMKGNSVFLMAHGRFQMSGFFPDGRFGT